MKVLLKEDIDNLGYAGEVMSVADGYGRNFLIPQGKAVKATPSVLKQANVWRERAAVRMVELKKEHEALAARIAEVNLEFTARAGETGKLYGSVTTADVVEQLNDSLGTEEIDRRSVVGGPLRQLGEHKVTIRLSRDYQPQVTVTIIPFIEEEEEIEQIEDEAGDDSVEASDEDDLVESELILESEESETLAEEPVDEVSEADRSEDAASEAEKTVEELSEAEELEDAASEAEETVEEASEAEESEDAASEPEA
jgi:large subunit ribosomal protein L9